MRVISTKTNQPSSGRLYFLNKRFINITLYATSQSSDHECKICTFPPSQRVRTSCIVLIALGAFNSLNIEKDGALNAIYHAGRHPKNFICVGLPEFDIGFPQSAGNVPTEIHAVLKTWNRSDYLSNRTVWEHRFAKFFAGEGNNARNGIRGPGQPCFP